MVATRKPLLALTAADLMSRDVTMIPQTMSLRTAARLLSKAHVTGAPVVDDQGRCAGVLSATDFMHWSEKETPACAKAGPETPCVCEWEVGRLSDLPADRVEGYMTTDPVTVPPGALITELARMMLDAHIHRVIVVDEAGRPVGVVSSMDVPGAVARAGAEPCGREVPHEAARH